MSVLLGNAKGVAIGIQADMWDPAITTNPVGYSGGFVACANPHGDGHAGDSRREKRWMQG